MTTQFIQQTTGFPEDTIAKIMDAFVEFVKTSLEKGDQVEMRNFGIFSFKDYDDRPGRNPRTGESITLPAKRKPTFKFSKNFIQSIQSEILTQIPTLSSTPLTLPSAPTSAPPTFLMPMSPPPIVSKNWYLADATGAFFEVPEHELKSKGLNYSSMLWSPETDWKKASDIPVLAYLLV